MNAHRALLIHPGIAESGETRVFPPWGILYVQEALRRAGNEAMAVDLNGVEDLESALETLVAECRPTLLGLTGKWGLSARRSLRLARAMRSLGAGTVIVLGGPLASNLPPGHSLARAVDAILPGDGEIQLPRWIAAGCPDSGYRPPTSEAVDLDAIGLAVGSDFDLGSYRTPPDRSDLGTATLYVSAARGCVARCTFCYLRAHYPDRFRVVSPDLLIEGLLRLRDRHDLDGFYFVDDCLVGDWAWTDEFCGRIRELGTPFVWGVDLRLAEMTPKRLGLLWGAGCRALYVGLESVDDGILEAIRKGNNAARGLEALDLALDMGFVVRAAVVIGWRDQSLASVERTLAEVEARPSMFIDAFQYHALPGTPYAESLGLRGSDDLVYADYTDAAPNVAAMSDSALEGYWKQLTAIRDERNGGRRSARL